MSNSLLWYIINYFSFIKSLYYNVVEKVYIKLYPLFGYLFLNN